jgi:hypothetical protein
MYRADRRELSGTGPGNRRTVGRQTGDFRWPAASMHITHRSSSNSWQLALDAVLKADHAI